MTADAGLLPTCARRSPAAASRRQRGPTALVDGRGRAGGLGDVGDRRRGRPRAGPARGGARRRAGARQQGEPGLRGRPAAARPARGTAPGCIPVDSEHSAIFQALRGEDGRRGRADHPDRLGRAVPRLDARRGWPAATPAQARAHPNWDMGERISIDSATHVQQGAGGDRGAGAFRRARPSRSRCVVHPQSIVHSMVGFRDGSIIAQLGPSDMRGAIGFALNWPERRPLPVERLDFAGVGRLDFARPIRSAFRRCGWRARRWSSAGWRARCSTAPRRRRSTPSSRAG